MHDWTTLSETCPACKTNLKIRVDIDFDAEIDLECEGQKSQEELHAIRRDDEGNIIVPPANGPAYSPLIPNVGILSSHHPEGKLLVHGVERPVYIFGHMLLLDNIPFLSLPNPMFEEYAGRDWTESLAKYFDFNLEWFNVYPRETNNAMTAMRTEGGELLCYAKRNDLDLFHTMCPKPTFTFPKDGAFICVYQDGVVIGGTMKMSDV